ncbi:Fork head protein [Purpureocillium lavendulum]|uniref:Fork head protein n=1 Tax=Purpureocillium lavendulum TaxID=1247861 RepID=A0AB34FYL0_9HYPO|nr:Fork head protein [Purpureocillium lavendulum]
MGRFTPLLLGALSALHVVGVAALDANCIPQCSATTRGEFTKFACVNADDAGCLCVKADFYYGVRDCAKGCGATEADVHQALVGGFCPGKFTHPSYAYGVLQPAYTDANRPDLRGGNLGCGPFQQRATNCSDFHTCGNSYSHSHSHSDAVLHNDNIDLQLLDVFHFRNCTANIVEHFSLRSGCIYCKNLLRNHNDVTNRVTQSIGSSTETSAPSTTAAGIPASATSSEAAAGGSSNSGLSQAAVIGIGVGIGAAVIAIAGIVICLLLRNRKRQPRQHPTFEISKPLPGAGRTYGGPDHGSFEKYHNDIELSSNRSALDEQARENKAQTLSFTLGQSFHIPS